MWTKGPVYLLVAIVSFSLVEEGLTSSSRFGRSLVNTFPFTSGDISLPERVDRQGNDGVEVDFQSVAEAGKRCIDKVTTEEETEYDEVIQCDHSYDRRCHTSYSTTYEAQQEEDCEENYKKDCFIEYSKTAVQAEVEICVEPLIKDCDSPGPEICSTEYQSECETRQEVHDVEDDVVSCETVLEEKCEDETSGYTTNTKCSKWPKEVCQVTKTPVKKFSPDTRCEKIPVEICGPSSCGVTAGPVQCRTEVRTIPGEKPEEQCNLEPQRTCKHVTKLVPQLKPHESCTDVPKEVCTRSQTNPRKVQKPVVTKWCYEPTAESGLEPEGQGSSKAEPASCSSSCQRNIRNNVCKPECNVPECPPCSPPPTCSSTCLRNIRNNVCSSECNVPECPTCTPPPATPPSLAPPKCSSSCLRNIRNNVCKPECNVPECPPCSPPPPPSCSSTCLRNIRNNVCKPECNVPECPPCSPPPAPTCSSTCQRNIRNNVCKPECNVPECPPCSPPPPPSCSSTCLRNIRNNVCKPECNVPECPPCSPPPATPPKCSASCKRNIQNNVCKPECNVPECPPCSAPLQPGYLPPPPGNSVESYRSSSNLSKSRSNSIRRLPARNQFARKQKNSNIGSSASSSRSSKNQRTKFHPAPKSRRPSNWDVLFKAGVVKNRSSGRLRTARTG